MRDCFKTILIPVDLTVNTEVAVKKSLELATVGTEIHLLHIYNYTLDSFRFFYRKPKNDITTVRWQMEQWRSSIEELGDNIKVVTWLYTKGMIQQCIASKAIEIGADLIILGTHSHHSYFPLLNKVLPNKLTKATGVSVLTVKPGALHNRIKTVIVPITSNAAKSKMQVVQMIAKKCSVKVHLVAYADSHTPKEVNASVLIQMYQWLKASIHCQVEYAVLDGKNKAKTLLQYAEKVNADVLLVHPEIETRMGWWNRHIADMLPAASKVQVLAIQPAA